MKIKRIWPLCCMLLLALCGCVPEETLRLQSEPQQEETTCVTAETTEAETTAAQYEERVIYLTFDDGPGKNTVRLLDVLDQYGAKATFFVVKTGYVDTISEIARRGHTVAIHTATHQYKEIYASEEAYFEDLYQMREIIREKTGQESNILRFPGGSGNKSSSFNPGIMTRLTKAVEEKGFLYFDWTVDSKDAMGATTAQEVFQNVVTGIGDQNRAVVLQHDIKRYSVDAVERILIWGLENGYTFKALQENSPECHIPVIN